MSTLLRSETMAEELVRCLIPFLPPQSSDVIDEFNACEFIPAAHGAIHDLGILRTDLPIELIQKVEELISTIKSENDSFNMRFLSGIENGYQQILGRQVLI